MATKKVKVLRVVARKDKFRRAGFEFGSDPKNIPLDTLHHHQLSAIKGDPNLVSVEAEVVIDEDGREVLDPTVLADQVGEAEARLREWAVELNDRENALTVREAELDNRAQSLDGREADLAERESKIKSREEAMASADAAASASAAKKAAGSK